MLEELPQPRNRFVVVPSPHHLQEFLIYDSLLEQPIGSSLPSFQSGLEMVSHLNRITPHFFHS